MILADNGSKSKTLKVSLAKHKFFLLLHVIAKQCNDALLHKNEAYHYVLGLLHLNSLEVYIL